jgi:hypothetical protein
VPLPAVGAIGLGLVWGWWMGMRLRSPRHPWVSLAILAAATGGAGSVVAAFAGRRGTLLFAVAAAIAVSIHLAWQHTLRSQRRG